MFSFPQDIDFPDFSESELKEMALKFPCRVELFHSNVCYGVERCWPQRLFGQSKFKDLLPQQKCILIRTMLRDAVKLYDKYVDKERLRRRRLQQTNRTLAEYYQERYLRNRFVRIRALSDNFDWSDSESNSDCSIVTVIDNENGHGENENAKNGPCTSEADSNSTNFRITKRRPNRIGRNRVSTRSMKKALSSRPKTSTNVPHERSNQLVSSSQTLHNGDQFLNRNDFHSTQDDGISMLIEAANQNMQDGDVCHINIVEHIDITADDSIDGSDEDGMLIIDESYNEMISESTVHSSYDVINNSNECNISPPQLNTNEFVRIESLDIRYIHESFNESVELFLSQINTSQIN